MSNFAKAEKVILSIAIALLLVFSYFLYDDSLLFPKSDTQQLELIGSVALSQNDVRRKNLDTFSWLPASTKDSVFQNDSIYTGERSEAIVSLSDGTKITIAPNSLINLNLADGQMNLDLRYGNLTGEIGPQSSLVITSGNEEIRLESQTDGESSKIQLGKSHSGNVSMKLLSGNIHAVDKNRSTRRPLPRNSPMAFTKSGEVKQLARPSLQVVTEDKQRWLRLAPRDPLPFKWESQGPVSRYQVEFAPTPDFKTLAATQYTQTNNLSFTQELPSGQYYWRIKTYDVNGQVSAVTEPRQFELAYLSSPRIISPDVSSPLQYEVREIPNQELRHNIPVRWQAHPALTKFQWQIAEDPEFTQVLHQGETQQPGMNTPALPSGLYYVRVSGQTQQNRRTDWSEVTQFQLQLIAKKDERPQAPILVQKNIDFKVPSASDDRTPASLQSPQISWKPVPQTKGYSLQISTDPSFRSAQRYDTSSNKTQWSQFKPGKYYYRVFARGENNLTSPPSEVGTLEIRVDGIVLQPIQDVELVAETPQTKSVDVKWSEVPFAAKYIIQIDTDPQFRAPRNMEFASTQAQVPLQDPGQYHIRVQALDEQQNELTSFSNIEDVLYSFRNPLASPALREPFNNASIFLQTDMEPFVWLEWRTVDNATAYRIEVSDRADFSNPLIVQTIHSNRFLIKEKIPLGKVYWRVRAEAPDKNEYSNWTERREFTLYHQKNETFVK